MSENSPLFGYGMNICSDGDDVYLGVGAPGTDFQYVKIFKSEAGGSFTEYCTVDSPDTEATTPRFGRNLSLKYYGGELYMAVTDSQSEVFYLYKIDSSGACELQGSNPVTTSGIEMSISSTGQIRIISGNIAGDQVTVWDRVGSSWSQVGTTIGGMTDDVTEYTGIDVDIDEEGTVIAVGATRYPSTDEQDGYGEVYEYIDGDWNLRGGRTFNLRMQNLDDASYGYQVCLSGDGSRVAFSAHGVSTVEVYDWS
jgi:hypothetical protein